jgi:hypothetical protein
MQVTGEATAAGFQVLPTGMVMLGPTQLTAIGAAGPGAPAMAEELQLQAIRFTEDLWSIMLWISQADVAAGEQLMALCVAHGGAGRLPLSSDLLSPGQPGYRGRDVGNAELDDLTTAFPVRVGDASYGRRG